MPTEYDSTTASFQNQGSGFPPSRPPLADGGGSAAPPPPPIDRLEFAVAGRTGTLRQHAIWITGQNVNYVEEQELNQVARKVEEKLLGKDIVEHALYSWAVSSGKKALRYFLAIVEKKTDTRKVHAANDRKPSFDPNEGRDKKLFADGKSAAEFVAWLKGEGVKGSFRPSENGVTVFAANVESLYRTYERQKSEASQQD